MEDRIKVYGEGSRFSTTPHPGKKGGGGGKGGGRVSATVDLKYEGERKKKKTSVEAFRTMSRQV